MDFSCLGLFNRTDADRTLHLQREAGGNQIACIRVYAVAGNHIAVLIGREQKAARQDLKVTRCFAAGRYPVHRAQLTARFIDDILNDAVMPRFEAYT